jgi:hypothetical protein
MTTEQTGLNNGENVFINTLSSCSSVDDFIIIQDVFSFCYVQLRYIEHSNNTFNIKHIYKCGDTNLEKYVMLIPLLGSVIALISVPFFVIILIKLNVEKKSNKYEQFVRRASSY